MGLLDDAIREHLELKRRRGADPGEVARAEHDALGPVQREAELDPSLDPDLDYDAGEAVEASDVADAGETVEADDAIEGGGALEADGANAGGPLPADADEPLPADADEPLPAEPESSMSADPRSIAAAGSVGHDQGNVRVAQETAEIDMRGQLHDGRSAPVATPASAEGRSAPVGHPAHTRVPDEESLEWEVPAESGGDRVGEPAAAAAADADVHAEPAGEDDGEHPEDVLEETPDFLRDTPEQERLWFEQRPPRDFDFNE